MPNGFTSLPTSSMNKTALYIYVVDGFILMASNLILILFIYSIKQLRQQKEYIIFAGNMIYDAFFGFQYFLAGIRRMGIFYGNNYCKLKERRKNLKII